MCNAPKFGDLEERTGYGGGFNEREGVEYIQREESDDEFDEFGRKKKKFRSKVRKIYLNRLPIIISNRVFLYNVEGVLEFKSFEFMVYLLVPRESVP